MEERLVSFFLSIMMLVTGYCDQTGAPPWGITASGIPTMSFVVACPPEMEFGTIIIMDDQIFVCADRGSAIMGRRLDRWFSTCKEAMEWGRQAKIVSILLGQ